ncbi:MAG: hypothetical protein ACOVP1_00040 [Bacteroidia bacterium]
MKNLIVLYFLIGSNAFQSVYAENKIRLNQIQKNQGIDFEINGSGNKRQRAVMNIVNKTNQAMKLIISAGDMLITPSKEVQNLIITQSEEIELAPHASISKPLFSLCAEKHDMAPSSANNYYPGNPAQGNLLAMAQFIDQHKIYDDAVAQAAVWCITDHADFSEISHANKSIELELQKMVAKHQHLDLYKELAKKKPKLHRQVTPLVPKRITSFHGNISFNLEKESKVDISLFDPNGLLVAEFSKSQKFQAGINQIEFKYTDEHISEGLYQIIVVADGKEKMRRRVQLR